MDIVVDDMDRRYRSGFDAKFLIEGLHLFDLHCGLRGEVLKLLECCLGSDLHCLRTRRRRFWKYSKRKVVGW